MDAMDVGTPVPSDHAAPVEPQTSINPVASSQPQASSHHVASGQQQASQPTAGLAVPRGAKRHNLESNSDRAEKKKRTPSPAEYYWH